MDTSNRKAQRLDPFGVARLLLQTLVPDTSTPVFKKVSGLLRSRSIPGLATLGSIPDVEYQQPGTMDHLLVERQVAALFKKNEAFADETRCKANAQKNFERGEVRCRITNKRLTHYYAKPERVAPDMARMLWNMEDSIRVLLGSVEDLTGNFSSLVRLTNGATEDRSRRRSFPFLKVSGHLRGPARAVQWIGKVLLDFGVDLTSCVYTRVEHNVLDFVPKNWKTYRLIAKEPTHSLPFQLAIDNFLKGKLRRWGINLRDQSKNQELARLGSLDGSFATIDLEMASDTLSIAAVEWMVPPEWKRLFDCFRSSYFVAPWGSGEYAKYSSMGNGFTFSLETMIFAAACRAAGSRTYAVYGDDLVVEADIAPRVIELLRFLGFRTNVEKTYLLPSSRFRESCGCDYLNGTLVTPFYLRELPQLDQKASLSHVLNGLVGCSGPGPLWDWVAKVVEHQKLHYVPYNEDTRSGVFITPTEAWKRGILYIDQRRRVKGEDNPNFGFPVYDGYQTESTCRKTRGWRSLFIWFIMRQDEEASFFRASASTAGTLIQLPAFRTYVLGKVSLETSRVSISNRFVHSVRRYHPKPLATPGYLYVFPK